MNVAKWVANFIVGAIVLFVGLYFVISLCIAFFKITGQLVEGQPMFFDAQTPTWTGLIIFQIVSVTILGICFFLRGKLRGGREYPKNS